MGIGLDLHGLLPDPEEGDPADNMLRRVQRANAAAALKDITPAPQKTPQTFSDSTGGGFFDQLKKSAAYNTQRFLDFVNDKQPDPNLQKPEPKGLPSKAGDFAAGVVDPANLIAFGPAAALTDQLGIRTAGKFVGSKVLSLAERMGAGEIIPKLAGKAAQYSTEGAIVGGAGSPGADALKAKEEGRDYGLADVPGSVVSGAATGALLDPAVHSIVPALKIGDAYLRGASGVDAMEARAQRAQMEPHNVPADATFENYDPFDDSPTSHMTSRDHTVPAGADENYDPFEKKLFTGTPLGDVGAGVSAARSEFIRQVAAERAENDRLRGRPLQEDEGLPPGTVRLTPEEEARFTRQQLEQRLAHAQQENDQLHGRTNPMETLDAGASDGRFRSNMARAEAQQQALRDQYHQTMAELAAEREAGLREAHPQEPYPQEQQDAEREANNRQFAAAMGQIPFHEAPDPEAARIAFERTPAGKPTSFQRLDEVPPQSELDKAGKTFHAGRIEKIGDKSVVVAPVDHEYLVNEILKQKIKEETARRAPGAGPLSDQNIAVLRRSAIRDASTYKPSTYDDATHQWIDPNEKMLHSVQADLHYTGTAQDPTLHLGWLRHSNAFPRTELKGRLDSDQPIATPRATAAILQHVLEVLKAHPEIKHFDTNPVNTSVMKLLSKYGGQWEKETGSMVVDADRLRNGIKQEVTPEQQQYNEAVYKNRNSISPGASDPTGRIGRARIEANNPYRDGSHAFSADENIWAGDAADAMPRASDGTKLYAGTPLGDVGEGVRSAREAITKMLGGQEAHDEVMSGVGQIERTGDVKKFGSRMDLRVAIDPHELYQKLKADPAYANGTPDQIADMALSQMDRDGNPGYPAPHAVSVDLHRTGTKADPTLSVGHLKHTEDFPHRDFPGRSDSRQPIPTPRETLAIIKAMRQVLIRNKSIKWLDTNPINTSVMEFLAKFGGRFENGGTRFVVPADNLRNNIKSEPHPDVADAIGEMKSGSNSGYSVFRGLPEDPFGRMERTFRSGKDPELTFMSDQYMAEVAQRSPHEFENANPRDPDTGLLLYAGTPLGDVKAGVESARAKLADELGSDERGFPVRPVLNVDKLPIDMAAKRMLNQAAEEFRGTKEGNAVQRVDYEQEASRLAEEVRRDYNGGEKLDPEKARKLSGVELRARTEVSMQLNADIAASIKRMEELGSGPEFKRLSDHVDHLRAVQHNILSDLVIGGGERGRDLRALRYAPDHLTGWLKKATAAVGPEGKIPDEMDSLIRSTFEEMSNAGNPQDKASARGRLEGIIDVLTPRPLWQHITDLFKTIITPPGPLDTANALGNTAMQVAEISSQAVGSTIDTLLNLFTNRDRTVAFPTLDGGAKGIQSGLEDAKDIFTTGHSEHQAGKFAQFGKQVGVGFAGAEALVNKLPGEHLDLAKAAIKADKFMQSYMKYHWGRFGAADAIFREFRLATSLVGEAHIKATNEGLSGKKFDARVKAILADPSSHPALVIHAIEDALYSTFNDENRMATGIHTGVAHLPPAGKVAANVTIPFVRTVANVASAMVDYTPVVGMLHEMAKNGTFAPEQRKVMMSLGRQTTGAGLVAIGYMLAKGGSLIGSGPTSTPERQHAETMGQGSYRIRMGNDWRDYKRVLGPLALPLALGADFYEYQADQRRGPGHSATDKLLTMGAGSVGILADQTPGGNLSSFQSHDSEHPLADMMENLGVSALSPNLMGSANVAAGLDNNERATDSFFDRLKARVPGPTRESLPEKVDATGRHVPRAEGLLATYFDPTNPRVARDDPALIEMQRLGVNFAKPATAGTYLPAEQKAFRDQGITDNKIPERYDRTPADVRDISERAGPETLALLNKVMSQPSYAQLSDELRVKLVQGIMDGLRNKAVVMHEIANPQVPTLP